MARRLVSDGLVTTAKKHTIHLLLPLCREAGSGEAVSFMASVAVCLGSAVAEDRMVHAYRALGVVDGRIETREY